MESPRGLRKNKLHGSQWLLVVAEKLQIVMGTVWILASLLWQALFSSFFLLATAGGRAKEESAREKHPNVFKICAMRPSQAATIKANSPCKRCWNNKKNKIIILILYLKLLSKKQNTNTHTFLIVFIEQIIIIILIFF